MKRKLPDHIPGTVRMWRVQKRREWRAVMKAFEVFRLGCVYTPVYRLFPLRPLTGMAEFEHTVWAIHESLRGNWKP